MAFDDKNGNNKQHLNLSQYAYDILQYDMFIFGEDKFSSFINTIFEYYCSDAEASISLTLNCYHEELDEIFSKVRGDEKTKRELIDHLITHRKKELLQKTQQYERDQQFKIWLNKHNFDYLTGETSECSENLYYPKRGQYIKCVLEEYARLPYIERELIYFTPYVKTIKEAISLKVQLCIVTANDKIFYIYPYDILHDPLSTTNYLVEYSYSALQQESDKTPCSLKIATLKSVKLQKSKHSRLKEADEKLLNQKLETRGVQFMIGEESEIHVRLTPSGITRYYRQVHLRPSYTEIREQNIYIFNCTEAQAQFYFFKFGSDAEILKPEHLREKIQKNVSLCRQSIRER